MIKAIGQIFKYAIIICILLAIFWVCNKNSMNYRFRIEYSEGAYSRSEYTNSYEILQNGCIEYDGKIRCGNYAIKTN